MSNKTFLGLQGSIYIFFAIALFFFPSVLWPQYGVEINDRYAIFLSQHNSIFLGGLGLICLLFRNVEEGSPAARSILLGMVGTNALGALITLMALIQGVFTGFGWTDPAFFALLTILGILQLRKN